MARPVRLVLASQLGSDIDGAWWPHTASVASELPELIGVLHASLGEIVDIGINWSPTEGPVGPRFDRHRRSDDRPAGPTTSSPDEGRGKDACAKLLVVPYMTSPNLGAMVMRCAAGLPAAHADRGTTLWETAHNVMGVAKAESAIWADACARLPPRAQSRSNQSP